MSLKHFKPKWKPFLDLISLVAISFFVRCFFHFFQFFVYLLQLVILILSYSLLIGVIFLLAPSLIGVIFLLAPSLIGVISLLAPSLVGVISLLALHWLALFLFSPPHWLLQVHSRSAQRILATCLRNGGLYIKFGQGLVSMNHVLPKEYLDTLRVLQNQVPSLSSVIKSQKSLGFSCSCALEVRVSEPACFGTAPAPEIFNPEPAPAPGKREQKFGFF